MLIGIGQPLGERRQIGKAAMPSHWPRMISVGDWDPIALHDEMKRAGLLRRVDAAE
jgi:hypothetical protein